jgi:hypothetical protein
MTGLRWRKLNPIFGNPYPLVLDADGKCSLKGDGFLGVAHQQPGEWFWTGYLWAHGQLHYFNWPDAQVAAWDLHRHLRDSRDLGPDWIPATWFRATCRAPCGRARVARILPGRGASAWQAMC